ncbi:MAG: Ser-Thr-rich GPI-anchored membrane family protein [Candidatus Pacebacteria bacterium]|nr:Ser-Thr-rich GPI-anchored membrane family protein [Candidatus Paceibacterota bacterium]
MNIKIIILSIFAALFGVFMFIYGGYDDSPGGQLMGLIAFIIGIVGLIKSKKKIILGTAIILVIAEAGVVFNFFNNKIQTINESDDHINSTYINKEGGYSFEYPKEWNAEANKYNPKNALFGPGATNESGYGGVEFIGTLSSGQSLKDFVKEFNSRVESGSVSETEAEINEQNAVISILPKASMEPTEIKSVSFEKNGRVFNMYLMYKTDFAKYPEDKQRLDAFNKIISTFKIFDLPSIKVLSPKGGESWAKGQKVKITWSAPDSVESVNIRLEISGNPDSQNFNAAIVSNTLNTGSYEWTVQELYAEVWGITDLPASEKYLVIIEDSKENSVYDKSDGVFGIH